MKRENEDADASTDNKKAKSDEPAAPAPEDEDLGALVNVEGLLEMVDNDVDFAVDLLNDALGEFSSHVDTMREAVAGKKDDWPLKVRIASHSIKGVAGNLSMERVHKSSAALETWGREREGKASDDDLDAASASVDRLDRYVGQIRTWAETARETLEAAGAN